MENQVIRKKIRSTILGAVLGDALGGPFEFNRPEWVQYRLPEMWFDTLFDYPCGENTHGIWGKSAPAGTGTDDTRYNWLFLELAREINHIPSPMELAERFLDVYAHPAVYFPTDPEMARAQFKAWEPVCQGYLGRRSSLLPDVSPEVLRGTSVGLNFPSLIGLITLTTAGTLFSGNPSEAYIKSYEADFVDLAYAKECVGLLAYIVSALLPGDRDTREVIDEALTVDPLHLGGMFGGPFAKMKLPALLRSLPPSCTERELAEYLSRALRHYHEYDPYRTLAIAICAVYAFPDDPMKALVTAANHREIEPDGTPGRYLDIDCYACVTGAIAGAASDPAQWPETLFAQVVESNRQVYGIDLEKTIAEISELVISSSRSHR